MNVYEAAQSRLEAVFRDFDAVCVSFSGGKDSGVLLNLAVEMARKLGRRIGVFHIDYEAQYQMTTDYVDAELTKNADVIDVFRVCLPIAATCGTSMSKPYWIPWDSEVKDIWVRQLPSNSINESNCEFPWFVKGMWDYDLQEQFGEWYRQRSGAAKCAALVGIRTEESLNRWRAIHADNNVKLHDGLGWTSGISEHAFNAYPIFDWTTEDIWTANARQGWAYNKLYDLYWQAGLSVGQMRVANPFHSCGTGTLKLYRVIDPNTWGKMVGRTNGVNFSSIYGGTTAMGWKSIKLPPGHTWKTYMEFLLTTLPEESAENFKKKLETSREFWRTRGGCLSSEVVNKLALLQVPFEIGEATNYKTDKLPIRMEYQDDVDIEEFQAIPTYKRMCVCIMKNDHLCKYMGFSLNKTEVEMRAKASAKYERIRSSIVSESSVSSEVCANREDQGQLIQP